MKILHKYLNPGLAIIGKVRKISSELSYYTNLEFTLVFRVTIC